uniref:ODAD1 central coiled coil region domain-containing protein n=1 Tax=Anopheles christyi TaxID=43041 RepID=A0A182JVX9_9DIPT
MANAAEVPAFFGPVENLSTEERIDQIRRERAEIVRWKHRYQKIDANKPGETVEAFQIRCLNKRLVHLEREKAQKELKLKIFNAPVYRHEAEILRGYILQMLKDAVRYDRQIIAAKIDMSELLSQIRRANTELESATKAVPSDYVYTAALQKSRTELAAIESRLDNARKLEGKLHAENRRHRQEIENMLGERKLYNQQWQQYVRELNRNRKFLLDMIERATLAFNQGEDLCYRIDSLKAQENRDKRARVQEMMEVERQIVGTRYVNEFLRTKGCRRAVAELDSRLVGKRNIFKLVNREKVDRFSAIIGNTMVYLQLDAIHDVLFRIEKQQDKYMALFRYLNETNSKIEEANGIARDLEKDSERLQEGEKRKRLSDERNAKQDMQKLLAAQKHSMKLQKEVYLYQEDLEVKLGAVEQALSLVGFDRSKILQLMGGSTSSSYERLTGEKLMMALSAIERKVLEFVQMSSVCATMEEDAQISSLYGSQQCAECAEGQDVNQHDDRIVLPTEHPQLVDNVRKRVTAPEMQYRLHTLSQCKLPRSRMLHSSYHTGNILTRIHNLWQGRVRKDIQVAFPQLEDSTDSKGMVGNMVTHRHWDLKELPGQRLLKKGRIRMWEGVKPIDQCPDFLGICTSDGPDQVDDGTGNLCSISGTIIACWFGGTIGSARSLRLRISA